MSVPASVGRRVGVSGSRSLSYRYETDRKLVGNGSAKAELYFDENQYFNYLCSFQAAARLNGEHTSVNRSLPCFGLRFHLSPTIKNTTSCSAFTTLTGLGSNTESISLLSLGHR